MLHIFKPGNLCYHLGLFTMVFTGSTSDIMWALLYWTVLANCYSKTKSSSSIVVDVEKSLSRKPLARPYLKYSPTSVMLRWEQRHLMSAMIVISCYTLVMSYDDPTYFAAIPLQGSSKW